MKLRALPSDEERTRESRETAAKVLRDIADEILEGEGPLKAICLFVLNDDGDMHLRYAGNETTVIGLVYRGLHAVTEGDIEEEP